MSLVHNASNPTRTGFGLASVALLAAAPVAYIAFDSVGLGCLLLLASAGSFVGYALNTPAP
jgi:hypothetical protein